MYGLGLNLRYPTYSPMWISLAATLLEKKNYIFNYIISL